MTGMDEPTQCTAHGVCRRGSSEALDETMQRTGSPYRQGAQLLLLPLPCHTYPRGVRASAMLIAIGAMLACRPGVLTLVSGIAARGQKKKSESAKKYILPSVGAAQTMYCAPHAPLLRPQPG